MTGCSLVKREAYYSRMVKMPDEVKNGPMRLAQNAVRVQVMGQSNVSTFTTVDAAGYFIIHEHDLATFIQRKQLLTQILQDDEAKRLIVGKGLHKLKAKPKTAAPKTDVKNE